MKEYDLAEKRKSGMGRFFSPANLDRYRKLASGAVGDTERQRLFAALAGEMIAFKREVTRPPSETCESVGRRFAHVVLEKR